MPRIIAHIDMDAFFAAIEERDRPRLKGLPIVVGADPMDGRGRGVVSTANYKAREYGIRSALPISIAWQLSQKAKKENKPEAVFLLVNFEKYKKASELISKIVREFAKIVEEASIDEFYFDLSEAGSFEKAGRICEKIKKEVKAKENLTASVGIGPNKLIAKLASDSQKPDGLTIIKENEVESFLEKMPIRAIPGIGPKTEELLKNQNIYSVKDLKKISRDDLKRMMGRKGLELYEKARGKDDSPVSEEREIKSIGAQETFQIDTLDFQLISERLEALCIEVFRNFRKSGFKKFKTIVLTVRFSDFETKSRSHTLDKTINSLKNLKFEAVKLLMPFLDKRENKKRKLIRLIGARIENFYD